MNELQRPATILNQAMGRTIEHFCYAHYMLCTADSYIYQSIIYICHPPIGGVTWQEAVGRLSVVSVSSDSKNEAR